MASGPRGRHSSQFGRSSRRQRRRRAVLVLVVLGLVVVGLAVRVLTESPPPLQTRTVLAGSITLPGRPPTPPWPAAGQAAFTIPGIVTEASPHQVPAQIASVAKVMTAYVVLRDHPFTQGTPGFTYTVTAADVADYDARQAQAESVVPVVEGEQLDEDQLLEGLLVPSGNNYADMLADVDAGGTAAFVTKMNAAARSLGMDSTTYTDPSGFEATTLSTAADQALLAAAVMRDPVFASIVAEHSVTLPVGGTLDNFDTLIGTDGFVGIKTGSDASAGGCLLFASVRHTAAGAFTVFGAVLGQDVGTHSTATLVSAAQSASRRLVDTVSAGVERRTLLPAGTPVEQITGPGGRPVTAVTTTSDTRLGWAGTIVTLGVELSRLGHSVSGGQLVGTVTGPGFSSPVRTSGALPAPGLGYRIRHIL
jgi:D-alanyl-D-alanine carboxypeptidase (penicillin-binding protein 5/6)